MLRKESCYRRNQLPLQIQEQLGTLLVYAVLEAVLRFICTGRAIKTPQVDELSCLLPAPGGAGCLPPYLQVLRN